jgi:hypothetical protein
MSNCLFDLGLTLLFRERFLRALTFGSLWFELWRWRSVKHLVHYFINCLAQVIPKIKLAQVSVKVLPANMVIDAIDATLEK